MNSRRLGLTILFIIFELTLSALSKLPSYQPLSIFEWVQLGLAASVGGRAIAYMDIGEFGRWPFVKSVPHSSGAGEDNEPKHSGFLSAFEDLICCPICAGLWVALVLRVAFQLAPDFGTLSISILSIGGVAWFLTRTTELIEWGARLTREQTGAMNFQNKQRGDKRHMK
jgi:hypothetical protein